LPADLVNRGVQLKDESSQTSSTCAAGARFSDVGQG
jgi:hypothetical protein